jgi:outer membrane receptor protein involved in Fe transport
MKTQKFFSRARLSAGVAPVVLGLAMIAAPAYAQTAQAAEDDTAADEIVVTGSLIKNPNLEQSSPVTVVTSEEVELRQTNVAEQFLRELPSAVPSIGSQVNNGNGGNSFVNLRGIGSNRNLVLLDGQRTVPANLNATVDLNNIPLALIERTDILTGGATTTYGADAVSGVVNFITKHDFAGIELSASEQLTEKGDGNTFRVDATIGANFDDGRGNAVFSIGYQEADPVYQGDRAFSKDNISSFSGAPGGSGTSVPSRISGARLVSSGTNPALPNGGTLQLAPDGQTVVPTYALFNFNPYNIFQTPFSRFNMYGAANYEVSDAIEVYTQGFFAKNRVKTIIAPSGTFGSTLTLPLSNPFLPAGVRNQLCAFNTTGSALYTPRFTQAQCDAAALAVTKTDPNYREVVVAIPRRFVEAGTRDNQYTTTVFNYGIGARGGITDNISWDVYGSYGESQNESRQTGNGTLTRLRQAVQSTNRNTCLDTSSNCVPLNLFGAQGTITPAMIGFLTGVSNSGTTNTTLAQVKGVVSGDTGFAIATTPVNFATGVEYRKYTASSISDLLTQTPGEVLGNGAASPDVFGEYDVKEVFGELVIPILEDASFAKSLTLEVGGRYSDYSTAGGNTTWKVGGSWEPIDGLKFRGNYQRGARAPNIGELFSPNVVGLTNLGVDPCAGAAPLTNANLRAVCIAQGAPANTIGSIQNPSAQQANGTFGGNPNLGVEIAKTWTVGAVWQPEFVSNFSISVDYFNIKVTGAVSTPTSGDVISACFTGLSASSASNPACTGIRRNPLTGGLDGDTATTFGLPFPSSNLGRITTDGVDVAIRYKRDLGFADLNWSFDGTWNHSNKFQATPTGLNRECIGFYSPNCNIQPEYVFNQRTSLTFDDSITVSLLWRYLSGSQQEPDDIINGNGPVAAGFGFEKIPDEHYFDLSGRFEITDNATLTLTVMNLLNNKPHVVGADVGTTSFNSGNIYPSSYDPLGRRFAAAVKFKF